MAVVHTLYSKYCYCIILFHVRLLKDWNLSDKALFNNSVEKRTAIIVMRKLGYTPYEILVRCSYNGSSLNGHSRDKTTF